MKTILVTGGAGYIGSITARRLLEKGYKVIIYDNLSRGHKINIPKKATFVNGGLSDTKKLSTALTKNKVDAVIHFAAYAYVGESVQDPKLYMDNNIKEGISLLNTLIEKNVKKIIFSSSCAVYGIPRKLPITERESFKPISPYGLTKRMFENILKSYHLAYDLSYVALRYFNAAGAAYGIGEAHDPETHLIPLVLQVASGKRKNIKIFGTDYDTIDGTCIRDYIHVLDLADAHIAALQDLDKGKAAAYNLGTGEGVSVRDIIDLCQEISGKEILAIESPRRDGDPDELVADASKIKKELAWSAQYGIKEIIQSAWDWHKKN